MKLFDQTATYRWQEKPSDTFKMSLSVLTKTLWLPDKIWNPHFKLLSVNNQYFYSISMPPNIAYDIPILKNYCLFEMQI